MERGKDTEAGQRKRMCVYMSRDHAPQECEIFVRAGRVRADGLLWHLLELVRGEVRRVGDGLEAGYERRVDLADRGPVHAVEERMVFDLFHAQPAVL